MCENLTTQAVAGEHNIKLPIAARCVSELMFVFNTHFRTIFGLFWKHLRCSSPISDGYLTFKSKEGIESKTAAQ